MNRILIAINFDEGLYNFRKELLDELLRNGYEVHVAVPAGEFTGRLQKLGCGFHDTALNRRGTNPFQEIGLLRRYARILKEVKPEVVLTYTIKPNVYLGMLCGWKGIPYIPTITGLGTAVEGDGPLQRLGQILYRIAMKKAALVFFQNQTNEGIFRRKKIAPGRHRMLPGSGVNLERFAYQEFPKGEVTEFLFISRIMKEKGIEEFLDAAEFIRDNYPKTAFRVLGFMEEDYTGRERFDRLVKDGKIIYSGSVEDVIPYIRESQCTVHPSFYPEGMSNVCLESAACGRAVITTDRAGCRDTVRDRETGFLIRQRDSRDLIQKIEEFLAMPLEERAEMGRRGRAYMEEKFDRRIVVRSYMEEIANELVRKTD